MHSNDMMSVVPVVCVHWTGLPIRWVSGFCGLFLALCKNCVEIGFMVTLSLFFKCKFLLLRLHM